MISLADEKLTGFEALIRWEHPEKGIVPPDEFIPVLEKTPLIGPLGFWIVEEAARQIRKWDDEFSFSPPIRVNVNLSARQFVLDELCERIFRIVEEYRVPPESLAFEITESAFMEDMESANLMLLKPGRHAPDIWTISDRLFFPELSPAFSRGHAQDRQVLRRVDAHRRAERADCACDH